MKTLQYDEIHVENLEVFANHGVFPEETSLGQKFVISLTMYVDTRKAGKTDCLEESVHYGEVSSFMTAYTKEHPRKLIEAAAEDLAETVLLPVSSFKRCDTGIEKALGAGGTASGDGFRENYPVLAHGLSGPRL